GPGAEAAPALDAAEESVPERQTVRPVVVVEELVLELSHVDVRRTLGLAPLALEAEVHDLVEPLARELARRQPAGEHRTEGVRALLVPRGHVRGAHRALECLAARADAVTHLDRRREAALRREIEQRPGRPRRVRDPVAQVLGDPG